MNPFAPPEAADAEKRGPYTRFRDKVTGLMSHVPLRTRITGLVMVAVGLSVALASIAGWVTVRNQILSQMDNGLLEKATVAAQLVRNEEIAEHLGSPGAGRTLLDGRLTAFGVGIAPSARRLPRSP